MPSPPADPAAPLVAIVACHGQGLFEFGCAVGLFAPD
ncbi:AraC family transcriptional regulator, partial [Stenotrophomonas maltophilia]